MMGYLADLPLDALLEKAQEVGVLDRWKSIDGVLIFESSTMHLAIDEPEAKPFVCGLLRGYELALRMDEESRPRPQQ